VFYAAEPSIWCFGFETTATATQFLIASERLELKELSDELNKARNANLL
jgi:hypothetical protein